MKHIITGYPQSSGPLHLVWCTGRVIRVMEVYLKYHRERRAWRLRLMRTNHLESSLDYSEDLASVVLD